MSEPASSTEIERKLVVPDDFSLVQVVEPLSALESVTEVRAERPRKLVAVYYDTADYRLARSQITLRRRTGGTDSGWHLKLPGANANGDERSEVTLPLKAGRPGRVPPALADFVVAVTGGAALLPLATQETTRSPLTLMADDPAVEVVDDLVAVTDGRQVGTSYREVEVEVLRHPELLEPTVEVLRTAGAAAAIAPSKGVRALLGEARLPPVVDAGPRPTATQAADAAVAYHVRVQVAEIIAQDLRVRRDLPDAVHQYRVAARRLRSVLQAFAPLVDDAWAQHLRAELGWIADTLSQSRDREVLEARLTDALRRLPAEVDRAAALVLIQQHLESELAAANVTMEQAMRSSRYRELMCCLHEAAACPPTSALAGEAAATVLPPLVDARWRTLATQSRRLQDELDGHDDHWHRARIHAKKARYTVEACIPVFGKRAKRLARQLEAVTELLGEHQDAAIAASLTLELARRARGPRAAFALGALYEQQREQVRRCRTEFIQLWPQVAQRKWHAWLETSR